MADIFLSYAQEDTAHVRELAYFLEAQGFTVYWDTKLRTGDDYQLELQREIAATRAVLVLWSPNSVKSRWVRAEAAAAQLQSKFMPLRLSGLPYEDIPPPFNLTHTTDVANKDELLLAVKGLLARPAPTPVLAKQIRYELLGWFGIVGSAITILANLDGLLKLADWAHALVEHWRDWAHTFWAHIGSLLRVTIEPEQVPPLTYLVFILCLAFGARFSSVSHDRASFTSVATNLAKVLGLGALLSALTTPALYSILRETQPGDALANELAKYAADVAFYCSFLVPLVMVCYAIKLSGAARSGYSILALNIFILMAFSFAFFATKMGDTGLGGTGFGKSFVIAPRLPPPTSGEVIIRSAIRGLILFSMPVIVVLLIARPTPLARRLIFTVAVIASVAALSELSKLHVRDLMAMG